MRIANKQLFFGTPMGEAMLYTLQNEQGVQLSMTDYGATVVSIRTPDRYGKLADIVLGHEDYTSYASCAYFLGATVGRCCNRVHRGLLELDGKTYQLDRNDQGRNHLHGGFAGFSGRMWQASVEQGLHGDQLCFKLLSRDGDGQYPGNLTVQLDVSLSEQNEMILHYRAHTDATTVCNLTNHSYFNLCGHDSGDILGHRLKLYASRFAMADQQSIPTGELRAVQGTPMDFLQMHTIGDRIREDYDALIYGNGYDHHYVIDQPSGELRLCAEAYEPKAGRTLTCLTTCPGFQLYTGNFLNDDHPGKGNARYFPHAGFCLETQFAPDAVHHPAWESPILRPGEIYDQTTVYRFGVREAEPAE